MLYNKNYSACPRRPEQSTAWTCGVFYLEHVMNSGIYEILNKLNGHRYIGSAVNIDGRRNQHIRLLNNNKHCNKHLQHAWNKDGADAFDFQVVEHCFFFMLIPREQHYIDTLKPEYNIAPKAGSCLGVKRSDETKAKMSAARLGEKKSPEHRAKLSAAQMGKKIPPFTAEHRANMSAAKMGNKNSLGYKHTPEHRAKASSAATIYLAKRKLAESEDK